MVRAKHCFFVNLHAMTADMSIPSLAQLQAIRERIAPHVHRTPLLHSATLSASLGLDVHLKAELLQRTGSYKPRGIVNAVALDEKARRRGVITFSAGNAGQAVAYAARIFAVPCVVVMPAGGSAVKAAAIRGYGGEVVMHGTAAEAFERCQTIARERDLVYIPPTDHPDVIAGHASLALEVLEDLPAVHAIFAPIGGGGLSAGIATGLIAAGSTAQLVGVEPTGAATLYRSLEAGKPITLERVDTVADGLANPFAGKHTFPLIRDRAERIDLVEDSQIIAAMRLLMERCKLMAEPSGATALAGLIAAASRLPIGAAVVAVVSGGNIDLARLKALL